jgi:hypothetical protein
MVLPQIIAVSIQSSPQPAHAVVAAPAPLPPHRHQRRTWVFRRADARAALHTDTLGCPARRHPRLPCTPERRQPCRPAPAFAPSCTSSASAGWPLATHSCPAHPLHRPAGSTRLYILPHFFQVWRFPLALPIDLRIAAWICTNGLGKRTIVMINE